VARHSHARGSFARPLARSQRMPWPRSLLLSYVAMPMASPSSSCSSPLGGGDSLGADDAMGRDDDASESEEMRAAPGMKSRQAAQTDGGRAGGELCVLGKERDALTTVGALETVVEGGRVGAAGETTSRDTVATKSAVQDQRWVQLIGNGVKMRPSRGRGNPMVIFEAIGSGA